MATQTKLKRFNDNVLDNFQSKLDICTSKIKSCFISKSKVFKINGLDISPFLLDHIENNLNNKMHSLNGELNSLNSFLDIAKPAKVFAQHSLGIGYALGEISLEENIPALLISHGSHVPNSNPMAVQCYTCIVSIRSISKLYGSLKRQS